MKKNLSPLILGSLLILSSQIVEAKALVFGVMNSFTYKTSIDLGLISIATDNPESVMAPGAGIGYMTPFRGKWMLELDAIYLPRKYKSTTAETSFNAIQIPALGRLNGNHGFSAVVGIAYTMHQGKVTTKTLSSGATTESTFAEKEFKENDTSYVLGLAFTSGKMHFEYRMTGGLSDIDTVASTSTKSSESQIILGLMF